VGDGSDLAQRRRRGRNLKAGGAGFSRSTWESVHDQRTLVSDRSGALSSRWRDYPIGACVALSSCGWCFFSVFCAGVAREEAVPAAAEVLVWELFRFWSVQWRTAELGGVTTAVRGSCTRAGVASHEGEPSLPAWRAGPEPSGARAGPHEAAGQAPRGEGVLCERAMPLLAFSSGGWGGSLICFYSLPIAGVSGADRPHGSERAAARGV
jgi:hypothetical protein